MLTTFFNDPTTQSKTAFNFGIRLMVLSGRNTRNTRKIFIVALTIGKEKNHKCSPLSPRINVPDLRKRTIV